MRIVFAAQMDAAQAQAWLAALSQASPGHEWVVRPHRGRDGQASLECPPEGGEARADAAVVANPAPGALSGLEGLRLIQSLWAGVDRLVADPSMPDHVPLARMVDPSMTAAMVQSALWAVTALHRGFFGYAQQQRQALWRQGPQRRSEAVALLVLGLGTMGAAVGAALLAQGYPVAAWRRHEAASAPPGVKVFQGMSSLPHALAQAHIVINLLPLTPETQGIINAKLLGDMQRGAALVNFGRGAHVVEADLLAALDSGQLSHAVLDVFAQEPLPEEHPFWRHPRVTVLPHVAALTDLHTAAAVVADNLERLRDGRPLLHLVDRQRGY